MKKNLEIKKLGINGEGIGYIDRKIAVSYTHLDVYKRQAIPAAARRKGGHPAKRTFQALRIAVNDELNVFDRALKDALDLLNSKGRISVITFHSLEDKICKYTCLLYTSRCV